MESKKDTRPLPALIAGIKIEPGTLGAAPGRLPSFGGRRDLTLGSCGPSKINNTTDSKPKRIYTPNLNVQRNKNKMDMNIKEEHPKSKEKRERRKDDMKGRKKDKLNNLVQSHGVFAEGISGGVKRRFGGGGGGGERDSAHNFIPKPKLNLQRALKIDKEEEEMKLKELLRDDFIDDPSMAPDADYAPVKLPFLASAKIKTELKEEGKFRRIKAAENVGGIKIKQEILDDDDKDVMPKVEACKIKFHKEPEVTKLEKPELLVVQDVLQSKEPEFIFLQMPDYLPGLKPEENTGSTKPSTSARPSSAMPQSLLDDATQTAANTKHCTLNTLSEGCIGKLQLLKSGRTRLVLGNIVLRVDMGTQVGFREDLISVDLDESTHTGDMINLGPVKTHLVCSPDWETMLTKTIA